MAANDLPIGETPDESFVDQVKQVLEHLYDFPYLQRHPLAQEIGWKGDSPSEAAGQYLRRELIAAIEALSPGAGVAFRAPHARLYNLLHLHYVEGMTIQEAAHELGISVRQAYRDLRRGEENVAAIIWNRRAKAAPEEPKATHLSSIQVEMARLETHPQPTDVCLLVQHAQKAVEQLALQRKIIFQAEISPDPVIITADPVIARQILVSVLSSAIQQAGSGIMRMALAANQGQAVLNLSYPSDPKGAAAQAVNPMIVSQLMLRLGWSMKQQDEPDGTKTLILTMPVHGGPTILVIDDNAGLVELLDRYLTGHHCRVVAAINGREGLQLAQELTPDAIILDVMMPEIDGWEILQILRMRTQTAAIPIIICSVINDPELAYSLGASLVLPKPISRDSILKALRQLGVVS
jgi:CheY-like chemotaxis protein